MEPRPVTILILTWNGLNYTRRCLESLRRTTTYPRCQILVVDNGSSDGTLAYLRGLPGVQVVANARNLGFVKGNNVGIRTLSEDTDVILLNNDTEIIQPDWIERLQETAYRAADVGPVGCRLRYPDGRLQHAGTFMPLTTYWGQYIGGQEEDVNQFSADREVEGVIFACVYLKRAVLDKVGLLDEDYVSYFEDTDYCLKASQAGLKTYCCGSVTLVHHENASTKINKIALPKFFLPSQRIFKSKWKKHLQANRYRDAVNWHSLLNFPTGYAQSSQQIALALDQLGVEVNYRYVYGPGTVFPMAEKPFETHYQLRQIQDRRFAQGGVEVVYAQGDVFTRNTGKYKIGYTMLETSGIPAEWVRQANLMDEVWVPSPFNVETFRASGVTGQIHVVPLGINPDYFNPSIKGQKSDKVFTFLSIFEWGERKGPEILLRAFRDEFSHREDAALFLKIRNVDPGVDVFGQIEGLGLRPGGGKIVVSLNDIVPDYQLGVLYRSADCFVLPTRGEGWGMPILEAMACGLPVIATNWSAPTAFFNETNGYPIEVTRLAPAQAKCPYYAGFSWAEPSYDHLRGLMRYVYEHPSEARAKGAYAAQDALALWTWEHSARCIRNRLEQIDGDIQTVKTRAA